LLHCSWKAYLQRMETECITTVLLELFTLVETA
jgi:hypothetical protein